jgi:hypothetical protein
VILDPVTAILRAIIDLVASISPGATAYNEQYNRNYYCLPDIHIESPLFPYLISAVSTYNAACPLALTSE